MRNCGGTCFKVFQAWLSRNCSCKGGPSQAISPLILLCQPLTAKLQNSTGVSAIDDPDGTMIYDETMKLLEDEYPDIASDVCVMQLGPVDQMLDALLSKAKIALQLSTREGFEVKVSEAIHKG
jgi:hypothetical protein